MTQNEEQRIAVVQISQSEAAKDWPWFVTLGVLALIAGVLAIILPGTAALAIDIVIGALLIVDGVFQGIQAFRLRRWPGKVWRWLSCALSLIAGIILLTFPLAGIAALSLFLGVFFIIGAFLKGALAFQTRGHWGAGLLGVSAVLSLVLGVLVLVIWPDMAPLILGLIVGIYLIFAGVSLLSLGVSARSWSKNNEIRETAQPDA